MELAEIQSKLKESHLNGWLLYDFRRTNDLACAFLEIPRDAILTRRYFYWIPKEGTPIKLVHGIEPHTLDHLPGEKQTYRTWQELDEQLASILENASRIAMEYSPNNSIPYVSKVDGGTLDAVRQYVDEVVSSANLLQQYTAVLTAEQLESHHFAANLLDQTVAKAWKLISQTKEITEKQVQQFILDEFAANNCITDDPPICAVNANSADPHYLPQDVSIKEGDFILIDLWCKQDKPGAIYGDITRVGVAANAPTPRQQEIFNIVKEARDAAVDLIRNKQPLMGWEVDQVCRDVIGKAGYGDYFIHRTGHSIGESDHGVGANIDNYETHDERLLIPGTCFSIEPGIYLPGEFGVRLEFDVYLGLDGEVEVTGGIQNEITVLF